MLVWDSEHQHNTMETLLYPQNSGSVVRYVINFFGDNMATDCYHCVLQEDFPLFSKEWV